MQNLTKKIEKSNQKIKKGLEACRALDCDICPYRSFSSVPDKDKTAWCTYHLMTDTLEYINILEKIKKDEEQQDG